MEKTLKTLFDFQKLHGNERLQKLIDEAGTSKKELSLDELSLVSAAGDCFDDKRSKEAKDYKDKIL